SGAWPPAGAEPQDLGALHARAEASGETYEGVQAAWRLGDELFAEVALPEGAEGTEAFGIHPTLLDTVLHPVALAEGLADGPTLLPFTWRGVSLHAGGATGVRVRVRTRGQDDTGGRELEIAVVDTTGAPVLSADAVALRPAADDWLKDTEGRAAGGLFT